MCGGLCQDEQVSPQRTGEPPPSPKNLKGADPRNGGRQPKNWLSGPLRGTFLTPAGSSRSWKSTTGLLDNLKSVGDDFLLFSVSVHLGLRSSLSLLDLIHDLCWRAGREDVHEV